MAVLTPVPLLTLLLTMFPGPDLAQQVPCSLDEFDTFGLGCSQ